MRFLSATALFMCSPLLLAAEWSVENYSSLDLLAGRTGIADVRPTNDPHDNSPQMVEQNSGIYRGQWSWQSEMPELLYGMMNTGDAASISPSGFCALQAACVYADESLFAKLMEEGVAVDSRPGDWQQLGYVGDTPLGLLVRFMTPRSAAARVRMARVLLEKGANPDAPMTTWKGNRVVTTTPFCELGNQDFNHEMRLLLLQFGEQNLPARMAAWPLNWEWYSEDLVQHLSLHGVTRRETTEGTDEKKAMAGRVPLLDLIRKGDVEGVRLALEAGASIEVSPRARRYGQEPLFNIPARRKDSPEAAIEIARLLIDAGADVNALNRRGNSLRIHYDRYRSKASRALCAYLKSRGALVHPDSPMHRKPVASAEVPAPAVPSSACETVPAEASADAAAPAPVAAEEQVVAAAEVPQVEPAPQTAAVEEEKTVPSPSAEVQPAPMAAEAPTPDAAGAAQEQSAQMQLLLNEVQMQLQQLQQQYEQQLQEQQEAEKQAQEQPVETQE